MEVIRVKLFFDDTEFDAQFARTVGKAAVGMADVGECFATANRMTGGDYASWRDCWHATAERIERIADEAATAGRRRSAGEAYLRASEYYRASYFFDRADLTGSFLLSAWEATRRAFRAGLDHIDLDVDLVSVPYADTTLTGYLFRPQQAAAGPYPTVVTVAGYDSPIEEYYAFNVVGGTKRGYAVLMVDGPGQGSALYEKGLVFRHDYEPVFGAILDFAVERPEVDKERIALSGRSFGGYLAPRAACFERRARAVIADPGQYDLGAQVRSMLPPQLWAQVEAASPEAEEKFAEMLKSDPHREYYFMSRAVTHGAKSAPEYLRMLQDYRVPASQITAPTLVTAQPHDAETRRLYNAVTSEKMLAEFDPDAGEWGHCEGVALSRYDQVVHDWLDGVLAS
jgi:alpha-beta hydrolase superfamily lysophospholipase